LLAIEDLGLEVVEVGKLRGVGGGEGDEIGLREVRRAE
jgi:hypothetical protein